MIHVWGGQTGALQRALLCALKDALSRGERSMVIVPEQMTLQVERDIITQLHLRGMLDIDVLSPTRLSGRVFERAGADARVRIDARGKGVAVARALSGVKKQLAYYQSAADTVGLAKRMGAVISELKSANVSPDALQAHAQSLPQGARRDKLADIALVYKAYQAQLEGLFADGEDANARMLQRLPESGVAQGAHIHMYGFDLFTQEHDRLLAALDSVALSVSAYICNLSGDMTRHFAPVRRSIGTLARTASHEGAHVRYTALGAVRQSLPADLRYLSEHLLCDQRDAYAGVPASIRLYTAPTPFAEAQFIAQQAALEHERGVPYGDMTVLCASLPAYAALIESVIAGYGIPLYVAQKAPLVAHGLARCLLAALRAVDGFDTDDIIDLIKSGYAPLSEQEGWHLENYARRYGIRGRLWRAPFSRGDPDVCHDLEDARARLIAPLESLKAALKRAQSAEDALNAIYGYLTDIGAYQTLQNEEEALLARGLYAQSAVHAQVWKAVMGLLSQLHALLAGARLPITQVAQWFLAGLQDCELSALPPGQGCVLCGELSNLTAAPRVLFCAGLTDDALMTGEQGLLDDDEKQDIERAYKAYLGLDGDGHTQMKRLDVWKALCSARERLYLSYPQATQEGAAQREAYIIPQIRALFPALYIEGGLTCAQEATVPIAPLPTLDALARRLRTGDMPPMWQEAWQYLRNSDAYAGRIQALRDALYHPREDAALDEATAHALYRERITSVSRLELFAQCPFKHFVAYGLAPDENVLWQKDTRSIGTFYHDAMDGFLRLLPSVPDWPNITRAQCDAAMDEALSPLLSALHDTPMLDGSRASVMCRRYVNACKRVAWVFTKGARESAFRPLGSEITFGRQEDSLPPLALTLSSGERVLLRGKIDRVDTYQDADGALLYRVVDYKSGGTALDPAQLWYGTQLQLLLYLEAAERLSERALPVGVFYQHIDDPLADDDEKENIEDEIAKALRLKGVTLSDARVLRLQDGAEPPYTLPQVLKKDGTVYKTAMACTQEQLGRLIAHAHGTAQRLCESLRAGDIRRVPVKSRKFDACAYCAYAGICRRDALKPQRKEGVLHQMTFDELMTKI